MMLHLQNAVISAFPWSANNCYVKPLMVYLSNEIFYARRAIFSPSSFKIEIFYIISVSLKQTSCIFCDVLRMKK